MTNGRRAVQRQTGDMDAPDHRCPAFAFNLCCALKPRADDIAADDVQAQDFTVPARRSIWRAHETIEGVPIVCQGWAANSTALTDGRRQILSFVLPGEMVSASFVFDSTSQTSLEAVTDVRYRMFKRAGIRAAIGRDPKLLAALSKLWADESTRADQLAIDLGQRSADERIASLILHLADRLARRGMMRDGTVEFPLRHHHIADATGLTPVHAGKMLSELRRAGLVSLSGRSLTLLNPGELRRIAGAH
jgi:CRP-like cAMP-binding protein